jgi:hypothetical protein
MPDNKRNTVSVNTLIKPSFVCLPGVIVLSAVFALGLGASAQVIEWSGANDNANTDWSNPLNWGGGLVPAQANAVVFTNAGASTANATVDNIVDTNLVLSGLFYSQTDNDWHNTVINPGVTLTLFDTNISIMLDSGSLSDPPSGLTWCYNTISGPGGSLVVSNANAASVINVEQGSFTYAGDSGQYAILDMSALDSFNATVGRLFVAVEGNGTGDPGQVDLFNNHRATGWLYLAKTNVINLTQVGNIEGYGGSGNAAAAGPALVLCDVNANFSDFNSYIYLGQSNAIFADTITIGRNQAIHTSFFEFNPDFTLPSQLYLRGQSSNRVSRFIVADSTASANYGNSNTLPGGPITQPSQSDVVGAAGIVDLSAGTSDIRIDTLLVGKGFNGAGGGYVAGIFNMGAGTLDVNTLQLGVMSSAAGNRPVTGTLIANGANVLIHSNNLALGIKLGTSASAVATGNVNITGGSLNIANGNFGIVDSGQSASQITLADTVVTAAMIGSASAPIGALTIGDTTLNAAVSNNTGTVVAKNLTTDSVIGTNIINITSISEAAALSPVITLIQSANSIRGNGGADFVLGNLPGGYSGQLQVTATAVQLVLSVTPYTGNIWTGADSATNSNWSDGLNWSMNLEPNANGPADFNNSASVASSAISTLGGGPGKLVPAKINNVVDGHVTVLELNYGNTNGTYQNTYISNNFTLTVTSSGLTVGSSVLDLGNTTGNVTISGDAGTLDLTESSFYVGLGDTNMASTAQATLDMSGLGTFNASVANFLVGVSAVGLSTVLQSAGTVYLAQSNTIIATSDNSGTDSSPVGLDVGDAGDAETAAGYNNRIGSSLYLGWTNNIFADYITVGRQWGTGGIFFNPAVISAHPTVSIGGASANQVLLWNVGDGVLNTLSAGMGAGTNDFSGGTVNALVNTLQVGLASANSTDTGHGAEIGVLTFNEGTITADTVNVSYNPAYSDGNVYDYAAGTVNVNGTGTLIVTKTLNLAFAGGPVQGGAPTGTLNINGGSVWANTLVPGVGSSPSVGQGNATTSIINMDGGSLTVTNGGIGTASAPLTSLNVTNATVAAGCATFTLINTENFNVSGAVTIQVLSLPPIEVYPVTVTLVQSGGVIGGSLTNVKALFPAGYVVKTVAENANSTAIVVTLSSGPIGSRGNVYWVGPDVADGNNVNWSDSTNWMLPLPPSPLDIAYFDNTGESIISGIANADNIVDTNFQVAAMWYAETNIAPNYAYHNTVINAGVTLTVFNTNRSIMLDSGTQTDPANADGANTCYSTISGAGTLVVSNTNPASIIIVSQGSSTYAGTLGPDNLYASLDMSGLNIFQATVGRLLLGIQGVGATPGQVTLVNSWRQAGILYLAQTNLIHLTQPGNIQGTGYAAAAGPALVLNDVANYGDFASQLYLGQSNALYADTITIGRENCNRTAVFAFDPANFVPPFQLYLRGESSNRVSEFVVADNTRNAGFGSAAPGSGIVVPPGGFNVGSAGLVDLSLGGSDIMMDTLIVGKGYAGAGGGYAAGIFNMGTGTLNVNTLGLGVVSAGNASVPVTGTLNVSAGGSVIVNTQLALGQTVGGGVSPWAYGALNVGGAVSAASILSGGNSSIDVTNGSISLTSPTGSIGTEAAPIGSISLGNSTLNLALGGPAAAVVTSNLTFTGTNDLINVTQFPTITNLPATLTLIQQLGGPIVGADFVLGPLPLGYTGTLQMSSNGAAVQLKLTAVPIAQPKGATITSFTLEPATASLVISGANGVANATYYVLVSTNLPVWMPLATNTFDSSGNFSVTVPYSAKVQDSFYLIKSE